MNDEVMTYLSLTHTCSFIRRFVVQSYIHQLGMSLNHAAAVAFNAPQDLRRSQYVAAITPIKGIPFYGYHVGYSYFLKIYLFNPDFENRIVDLMRSGAIMGTHFQPFEAHVPFKLQFCIDFNLYGMGWVELEDALLRNDVPGETPRLINRLRCPPFYTHRNPPL